MVQVHIALPTAVYFLYEHRPVCMNTGLYCDKTHTSEMFDAHWKFRHHVYMQAINKKQVTSSDICKGVY